MENGGGGDFPFQLFSETGALRIGYSTIATPTAKLEIRGSGTTSATTALLVQNSAGTDSFKIDNSGTSFAQNYNTVGILGTYIVNSRLSISSPLSGNMLISNTSITDFNRLQFGGTTSSFPAIKRASNNIEIKNADDTFGAGLSVGGSLNASAILQADSTTRGFLPPRMTTAQRDAIVTPATGLRIYNTTTNTNDTYNGTAWQSNSVSGVAGAIQFSNGSAFASDAANLFWDDTNNRLGIGTNSPNQQLQVVGTSRLANVYIGLAGNNAISNTGADTTININNGVGIAGGSIITPTARLQVKGSGSTSATTSFLVQNSAGTAALTVKDDLTLTFGGVLTTSSNITSTANVQGGNINTVGNVYIGNFQSSLKSNGSGIIQLQNTAENNFNRLQFGGTTASFPSIKRNGTAIDFRLADDSAFAPINAGATILRGSGTTPATTSLVVQNSAGTEAFRIEDNLDVKVRATFRVLDTGGNNAMIMYGDGLSGIRTLWVNGSVGVGVLGNNASARLQVESTTQGFLPPRMTTTQKNAISSPSSGLQVYDTTLNQMSYYNGSSWINF
jgi:hypothetical protein